VVQYQESGRIPNGSHICGPPDYIGVYNYSLANLAAIADKADESFLDSGVVFTTPSSVYGSTRQCRSHVPMGANP
jgi:hypothetical protein